MSENKPITHLVWRQYLRAADDVEDYYEVARKGDKCVDGSEPFPVYDEAALAAKDAEIEQLRLSLGMTLSSLERWYRHGSPDFTGSAHPTSVIGTARGLVGLDPASGMPVALTQPDTKSGGNADA
jgi:hypothetical protein